MKALIILNHIPVQEMLLELKKRFNVDKIDLLQNANKELSEKFKNIHCNRNEVIELAKEFADFIKGDEEDGYNIVVIAGEPRFILNLIKECEYRSFQTSFYAPYSKRISEDIIKEDDFIEKKVTFKYECLAEY